MEPKKNPAKDIHRYKKQFFLTGLGISLMITVIAFEWTVRKVFVDPPFNEPEKFAYVNDYVPTKIKEIKDEPAKKVKPPRPLNPENIVEVKDIIDSEKAIVSVEIEPVEIDSEIKIESTLPKEIIKDSIFFSPEKMPEPVGGMEGFRKLLQKHLKYPGLAKKNGTEGIVYVQFKIYEDGSIRDLKVIRGIGAGCDEEAMRVLNLSKWNPGKQRGKPVKVSMVQPIYFKLD